VFTEFPLVVKNESPRRKRTGYQRGLKTNLTWGDT
jgi:hypothetical protein